MKLPVIELAKIKQIKPIRQVIYLRQNDNLNYLILPNNNISSTFNEQKSKMENLTQDYEKTQRKIINIFNKKVKMVEKNKVKKLVFKNSNSLINNPTNLSINNYEYKNDSKEYKRKNKIKLQNPFNSIKIRNEISSYIYSSPENQIRFINYIMKNKSNNMENNYKNKIIQTLDHDKLIYPIKKQNPKIVKIIKEDNKKDIDEDKINEKESSLLFLLLENKKKPKEQKDIKSSRVNKKNCIESWDNNLLKNILPKNIKEYHHENKNIQFVFHRNKGYKVLNSNNSINKTRYDIENKYKKFKNFLLNKNKRDNKIEIKSFKKWARSSSFC